MTPSEKIKPKENHPWRKAFSANNAKKQKENKKEMDKRGIK